MAGSFIFPASLKYVPFVSVQGAIVKWRLYYGDGSIYTGETEEEAFKVPTLTAIILKQAVDNPDNPRGYSLRQSCVAFCWENITLSYPVGTILEECRWGGKSDWSGVFDYIGFRIGPQKIVIGREIHDDTYHAISKLADNDGCLCTEPCDHLKPEEY